MSNQINALTLLIALLCILAGLVIGLVASPDKTVTVTKEVPGPETVREVPVEVIREVNVTQTVDARDELLAKAKVEFLAEVEDNDEYLVCNEVEYDFDQVTISKIYDGWTVVTDKNRHGDLNTVNFEAKLKYTDKDVSEKCYKNYDVEVVFEDGEDPELTIK